MSTTILVTAPTLADAGLEVLQAEGCNVIFTSSTGGVEEMLQHLRHERIDGVISRTLPFAKEAFDAAGPALKVVSRHGVGFDNVDVSTATKCGIPVLIAPAANGQSVAELTIGLMLAAARRVVTQTNGIRAGKWDRSGSGLQLWGKTLGLIGFGGIGKAVARVALGLGMRVIAFDPAAKSEDGLPVEMIASLQQLLGRSQFLSLHIPLTEETRHLIGATEIAALPKDAVIVNTSRGGLMDEDALAAALDRGHLYGVGLDTFALEPLPSSHPLCSRPDAVLTAHIGGSTDAALAATAQLAAQHALAIIHDRPFDNRACINPSTLKRLPHD